MTTSPDFSKTEDFEDGELPEDGEIQDEEEGMNIGKRKASPTRDIAPAQSSIHSSPAPRKPAPRGYGDDIEAVSEKWPNENDSNDFPVSSAEDRDYRLEDETYRDCDYRPAPGRRRRHSPTEEDFDQRGAKRSFGKQWRTFHHKPKKATEHLICKFFREGYCRDGDNCAYSHQAEDSLRKAELCRFYQNGFCKKGLTCLALHGEFPCRAFHRGECTRDPCHFSHQPLTDYTRPLVERMLQEDEVIRPSSSHYPPAGGQQPRRRVLLPQGPAAGGSSIPPGPIIHAPIPQQQVSNGQLAPPSVVVPTLATSHSAPYPASQTTTHSSGYGTSHSQPISEAKNTGAPQFDISQMLAQIAGEQVVEDSPASPPTYGSAADGIICSIPQQAQVIWRLVPVTSQPSYYGVDPNAAGSNDPRKSRVISSQFDAVSSLIAAGCPQSDNQPVTSLVRDPRRRPEERKTSDDSSKPRVSSWMPTIDR
ncbi:unnamed protein product [Auanema sp. JU1783]|nr:unnamed protein product [Auanema sp. JU1783]